MIERTIGGFPESTPGSPRRRLTAHSALLALALLTSYSIQAQVGVGFDPPVVSLGVGEHAVVAVTVGALESPGLAAFQLTLNYDPGLVQVLNPNAAFSGTVPAYAPLGNDPACAAVRGVAPCPDPPWTLTSTGRTPLGVSFVDAFGGRVQIAYATHGAQVPSLVNGAIALIELVGVAPGASAVSLSGVIIAGNQEPPEPYATAVSDLAVNVSVTDTDGDGLPDNVDPDDDNDHYPDALEATFGSNPLVANYLQGDVDYSGTVSITDLVKVRAAFGKTSSSPDWNPALDVDGSGTISILDLVKVRQNFGARLGP